ncbi:MAG: diguanylate cyclase [Magnetococcales bacterium]|nr:diguanylate cyclase [Magnetococcales bacterium]
MKFLARWFNYSRWTILPKILFISVFSVTTMLVATFFYFIPFIKDKIVEEKMNATRHVVETAYGVLSHFHGQVREGFIEENQAKTMAMRIIKKMRYREKEYFWINDFTPTMVMHPTFPEMDGSNLSDYRDPTGKFIFREFVEVAINKGSGFVNYQWPKPGSTQPVAKTSFVKGFSPWQWVIGSGIYLDDVETSIHDLNLYSVAGASSFALVTLMSAVVIGMGITSRLKRVIDGLRDIANGKSGSSLSQRIAITSIDEIGVLSTEFNALMESIHSLSLFKKVIEGDEKLQDIYLRIWEIFKKIDGVDQCIILETSVLSEGMQIVYPDAGGCQLACSQEILDNCDVCKVKRTGAVIHSAEFSRICTQFIGHDNQEHICFPMSIGGSTVGVIQVTYDRAVDPDVMALINLELYKAEQYVKEALPVIEAKKLLSTMKESAMTDALTGLRNRRFLQESFESLCSGSKRRGTLVGLLLCDLDHFKQVNDSYGHPAGDEILRQAATLMKEAVRMTDLVFRFGGEEFLIVLVDIEPDQAWQIAEKVRNSIEKHRFKLPEGNFIEKTVSIGVSEYPKDIDNFWQAVKYADLALYQSKSSGRNRSTRFQPEEQPEQPPNDQ